MQQARSAISNMFNGEPLSYTRFSLARQTDGDSHVELKMAEDEENNVTMTNHTQLHTIQPARSRSRAFCLFFLGAGLLFFSGFVIGYLSYRGRMVAADKCTNGAVPCVSSSGVETAEKNVAGESVLEEESLHEEPLPELYWSDLKKMLSDKLQSTDFLADIGKVSSSLHEAGSQRDEDLAGYIHNQFSQLSLDKVWNDEHYVTLQNFGSSPNTVLLVDSNGEKVETIESTSFVAYSAKDKVTGNPVFAYYGRKDDYMELQKRGISVKDAVVLVRAGKISFAEKVAIADSFNAAGVLIFPEATDYPTLTETQRSGLELYGHAHQGTGDPYTPGFPSFNHTQFPPVKSSGIPDIPVQTISQASAVRLLRLLQGEECPVAWRGAQAACYLGPSLKSGTSVKLDVQNENVQKKIVNVFGIIQGLEEPDRFVVIGAQRDARGSGAAKSGVGTSILLQLAQALRALMKGGYKPRRSILFASWSAGDFGAVGATEWLEGYLNMLHLKAFAYINLDAVVQGSAGFKVSASPMLYTLLEKTMKEVKNPENQQKTIYDSLDGSPADWVKNIATPLSMDNAAYPFLTYSGIPAISFRFEKTFSPYPYLDTNLDTNDNLKAYVTNLNSVCRAAAEIAGQMLIRITHDHELPLDYERYTDELQVYVKGLLRSRQDLLGMGLTLQWVFSARGDFNRATAALKKDIANSDLNDKVLCRMTNDRIMKVEHHFLSPYVSPKDYPFRHILYGSGDHTLPAMLEHLELLKTNKTLFDKDLFKNQLALSTWTLQGAANALSGDIWDIDNEF